MNRSRAAFLGAVVLGILLFAGLADASPKDPYPLRAEYPALHYVSTSQLTTMMPTVIVVDARSRYEYSVLHIKSAVNIPVGDIDFVDQVQALRANTQKPIVFYCNGHTCPKSYEASDKAISAGVTGVLTYDSGILDWTEANPDSAVLMGVTPADLSTLPTPNEINTHMLPPTPLEK